MNNGSFLNQGNIFILNVIMGQKNLLQNISFFVICYWNPIQINVNKQDSVFKIILNLNLNY